jgi:hypothetical protein
MNRASVLDCGAAAPPSRATIQLSLHRRSFIVLLQSGMNIFPARHLSDDELIERTRKHLNASRRLRWFFLVLALAWFGMASWLTSAAFGWVEVLAQGRSVQWPWFLFGLSTGLSFGSFIMLLVLKGMLFLYFFIDHLPWRKDRLLIQYYDQLHNKP